MSIARRPSVTTSQGSFVVPGAVASEPLRESAAVAVTGAGISECSSTVHAANFIGFAIKSALLNDTVAVVSVRGSSIVPIVEGGVPLVPTNPVYLSATLGEVTQTPPPHGAGTVFVQVGIAASVTELVLITDSRVGTPG